MKYISIEDNDYEKVKTLLDENEIKFKEKTILEHLIEDKIINNNKNINNIDKAVEFINNEINPLDIDLLINQALLIYESEDR